MTAFRDWPATLRAADFRGAKFFVDTDQIETGRRLVVHEFPHRDDPYVEDLGRKANKAQVTAYVVGDEADQMARALRAACERRGAGTLSLPLDRFRAHCEDCKRDFTKDRLGYIAFTIAFVRDGGGSAPFPSVFLGELVRRGALQIRVPLAEAFLSRFATLGQPGYVRDSAAAQVRDVAATMDVVARTLELDPVKSPALFRSIQALYTDAEQLVDVGARGDRYAERTFVQESDTRLEADLVTSIADVLDGLRSASAPDEFVTGVEPLITFGAPSQGQLLTAGRRQEAQNSEAVALAVRAEAIGQYAAAVVSRRYPDRRAAIQARADVGERFNAELERLAGWQSHALYVTIDEIRGRTAEHLTRAIADLAPVLTVGSELSMPSLWWAHRLYGDAARAGELATRNRVKHPSFMPTEFEALAR
jgi:hypothetical protein